VTPIKPPFDVVEMPSHFVLTGNPAEGELAMDVGITYTAAPPFGSPADPENRRLIDGDRVPDWWQTSVGINVAEQTVTFDLKHTVALDEARLCFNQAQKPASVVAEFADEAEGAWRPAGMLRLEGQKEAWRSFALGGAKGRFVRFTFKSDIASWFLGEMKLYGRVSGQAGATPRGLLHHDGKLVLADPTGPQAAIVLADRPRLNALDAAILFQKLTRRMTGALLPILPESQFPPGSAAICIGDSRMARAHGVQVEQTPFGDDRYVLRSGENWLALVGNDARFNKEDERTAKSFRGSTYAVYDLFERMGCGWYGPGELWQIVPRIPALTVPRLTVNEVPAFAMRDLWLGGLDNHDLRSAWRLGGLFVQQGHTYFDLVPPAKYKAEHPDWFGPEQPDITHPEVIQVVIEKLGAQMKGRPDEPIVTFALGANDTGGFKDPPHKPEVGNIAAQQLYFANEVAKGLRLAHVGRAFRLTIYGYWYSHDGPAPMLKAEPEVVLFLVNEGNHAKPLDLAENPETARTTGRNNTRELHALAIWKKTGQLNSIYEWWIPVLANPLWKDIPWYDGSTALRNLRLWQREGIRHLTYEIQGEKDHGFPLRWAQYYVGARGMWNPEIDPDQVLSEACDKLYGPAANAITRLYLLQQAAMRATTEHAGNWALPAPHLIYTPGVEAEGDALLGVAERSLENLPSDAPARGRVSVEREVWQRLKELNAAARQTPVKK